MRVRLALFGFVCSLICHGAWSAEAQTANTRKLGEGESPSPSTIEDMAWFAGTWRGTGLGGFVEEVWSEPVGGRMLGMYRLVKNDEPVFYELLVLGAENGALVMRLKHFHPDLRGWEEKDDSVSFRLIAHEGNRVYFEGLTFERQGEDRVVVYLAIRNKAGGVREETFTYVRATPGAPAS